KCEDQIKKIDSQITKLRSNLVKEDGEEIDADDIEFQSMVDDDLEDDDIPDEAVDDILAALDNVPDMEDDEINNLLDSDMSGKVTTDDIMFGDDDDDDYDVDLSELDDEEF
ncbi:MAG TPA: hypothetical protein DCW90_00935, partial [Lachnospiraceae bacterium]|nr:hypothetical protein [Lachnospiraceae bacterium]